MDKFSLFYYVFLYFLTYNNLRETQNALKEFI